MKYLKAFCAFSLLLSLLLNVSCISKKKIVYLQTNEESSDTSSLYTPSNTEYKLQYNDLLGVRVLSLDETANLLFNGANSSEANVQAVGIGNGDLYYTNGYTVDKNGEIDLPVIGRFKVVGMTIVELKDSLEVEYDKYFSKFSLSVKLGGIRFSALGEFNSPGKYVILQNRLTIFEAIARAGDLTTTASRANVKLIRQYPNGTQVHEINLLDKLTLNSPFYYVHPNDVIYVEPLDAKTWGIGIKGAETFSLILSTVTTALLVLSFIRR